MAEKLQENAEWLLNNWKTSTPDQVIEVLKDSHGDFSQDTFPQFASILLEHKFRQEQMEQARHFQEEQMGQTRRLVMATWALAIVTIILAIITACK